MNVVDPGTASASSSTMHSREKTSETELAFTLRARYLSDSAEISRSTTERETRPDQEQKLSQDIRCRLDQALPFFEWQSASNRIGQAQYLMTLLEESIRVLAPPMQPFVKALTVDLASIRAFQLVKQLVDGWALPSEDVLRTVGATQSVGLRQQLAEMQDQLEHAKRAQAVPVGMKGGGDMMNGNGGSTALSQASAGLINLVASKNPERRRPGLSRSRRSDIVGRSILGRCRWRSGRRRQSLLEDEDGLNVEVTMGLIRNLKIPAPGSNPPPTDEEVLFPAYLINLVTSEMWNNGFVKELERSFANSMQSIQQEVMQHDGDEAVNRAAFWLTNVHEMLSFVFMAEDWYEAQKKDDFGYDRLLETVKHDLESLEFNIYHTWMKVLKKKLQKMIVPAIIESQSLPGFVTNEINLLLGKLLP
ncbi:Myosin type-2 heavy chain 1 [Friedmanniomyces endolithicus]|nr:Myosin type-2 heavy chain 1 [Friedmanniomyces endolithicus]